MNRHLYILGAGGLGKEFGAYIKFINSQYLLMGYFDDKKTGKVDNLVDILGNVGNIKDLEDSSNLIIAIGDPIVRKAAFEGINKPDRFNFPSFIQPNVYIANKKILKFGKGVMIGAGTSLTTNIEINDFVLVNINCSIGHDVKIGSYASLMPGSNISGNVTIGDEVLVGAGATILQGISIGEKAIIGAGAVVINDVPAHKTVKGVPAK